MEAKRKLKLQVKTLDTRVAPGVCGRYHQMNIDAGRVDASQWSKGDGGFVRNDWSNNGGGDNNGAIPAGVPVIGIN